jgi:hypothetical protein
LLGQYLALSANDPGAGTEADPTTAVSQLHADLHVNCSAPSLWKLIAFGDPNLRSFKLKGKLSFFAQIFPSLFALVNGAESDCHLAQIYEGFYKPFSSES